MRRVLLLTSVGLLGVVLGCHHMHGVCDCDVQPPLGTGTPPPQFPDGINRGIPMNRPGLSPYVPHAPLGPIPSPYVPPGAVPTAPGASGGPAYIAPVPNGTSKSGPVAPQSLVGATEPKMAN